MDRTDPNQLAIAAHTARVRNRAARAARHLRSVSLADEVRTACALRNAPTPGAFLADVMAGVDSRPGSSRLLALVEQVADRGVEATPSLEEWLEIAEILREHERYHSTPVALPTSVDAAKTLVKQMYAAQKTDPVDDGEAIGDGTGSALTDEDLEKFAMWWEERYA